MNTLMMMMINDHEHDHGHDRDGDGWLLMYPKISTSKWFLLGLTNDLVIDAMLMEVMVTMLMTLNPRPNK